MSCPHCGFDADSDDHFCESCGKPLGMAAQTTLARRCVCGGSQFDADDYCSNCGQHYRPLDAVAAFAVDASLAWASHTGRVHTENQDAAGVRRLADGSVILAVSDGVSSADRAQEASALAVATVLDYVAAHAEVDSDVDIVLEGAIGRAHEALLGMHYDNRIKDEPQATLVVAHVRGSKLTFGWVGDSRIYALGSDMATQLTEDDSWLNNAVRDGMPYELAVRDRHAHCITQCLGMRDDAPDVHVETTELPTGTQLLLCSDGLWNYFDTPLAMYGLVAAQGTGIAAQQCCEGLINAANAAGGVDNITAALLRI
jgi:serine/threonine protein phosphatase PrpC